MPLEKDASILCSLCVHAPGCSAHCVTVCKQDMPACKTKLDDHSSYNIPWKHAMCSQEHALIPLDVSLWHLRSPCASRLWRHCRTKNSDDSEKQVGLIPPIALALRSSLRPAVCRPFPCLLSHLQTQWNRRTCSEHVQTGASTCPKRQLGMAQK